MKTSVRTATNPSDLGDMKKWSDAAGKGRRRERASPGTH
jgi:hypothetical protein